jgi:hypothetical protein
MSTHRQIGDHLIEALTQQEIIRLLDALWSTLPAELHDTVLDQLSADTRQTVQHILSPPQPSGDAETVPAHPVSIAKLEQTWSKLWQEWGHVVTEAADEEGPYMTQEAHWEPPYFDQTAFINDLEQIAKKMRPLVQDAFQYEFIPATSFAEALVEAENEIAAAMPDWIEIDEGFYLEENLTYCLLEWEWLQFRDTAQNAFAFAQQIRKWEDTFSYTVLESNAFFDFFIQLPETHLKAIFQGLTQHKDTSPWQNALNNVYSHWHAIYMYGVEQYAPERYHHNLRATIPQYWQNGLPVIEDLLTKKEYRQSLAVIQETVAAMLKSEQVREAWTPDAALLFPLVQRYYNDTTRLENHRILLDYYQQTAKGLGQTALVKTLSLQLIAFEHFFDWERMFKAFAEAAVSEPVRQALFASWRNYIIRRAKPHTWSMWGQRQSQEIWWLSWLIDSIVDEQKGPTWFQEQVTGWLTQLSGEERTSDEDYGFLRLLTKDLTALNKEKQEQYPQFYQVVIRPGELSSADQVSRQAYLKQFASPDLLDRVMKYWQTHLQNFVPKPEAAKKSDYTSHARWMAALRELAPNSYETLLDKWRTEHHRRRNLWQAMASLGLN